MGKIIEKDASNANSSKAKSNAHDAYCWICHNLKTTVFCFTCPRSYHSLCMGGNPDGKNEWRCGCCLKLERARSNWAKWKFDSNSIKIALNRALATKDMKRALRIMTSEDENENKLKNPIDLAKIKKKVKANEYETPEEFFVDIKWIQHNSSILHPNNPKYKKVAKEFVAACELELTSLSHCTDCYERSENRVRNWFTAYCIPPHLLIWAKYLTYPYWPAKLMSADNEKVDVQFFGDHTFESVPVDHCLIYSEKHPAKETITSKYTKDFEAAQEECQKYIKRIRGRFGGFKYGNECEQLNLKNMKRHFENMFPKLMDNGESIDIQFKRLIPMEKSSIDIDDSLNKSKDSTDTNEIQTDIVRSPRNDSIDSIELEIQRLFGPNETEKNDDESDPLRINFQSNDELNAERSSEKLEPSETTVTNKSNGDESKGKSSVTEEVKGLKRSIVASARKRKRMRLDRIECDHVNSSNRSESPTSCDSVFSQATVDFEFDKQNITEKTAAAAEAPVPTISSHDVVHSTQSTHPPNLPTGKFGLDLPIRAYIEALERLKDELWTQNREYGEELGHLYAENQKLREENLRLRKKN